MKRLVAALVLSLTLGVGTAHAQIAPVVYWACSYYIFGMSAGGGYITTTEGHDPSYGDFLISLQCTYLATCVFTQDFDGHVTSYCN
jgi:hypothetical protein